MKPAIKAPTYKSFQSDYNFKYSHGKKTLTDSLTMKQLNWAKNISKFKGHANFSVIGIVFSFLFRGRNKHCC